MIDFFFLLAPSPPRLAPPCTRSDRAEVTEAELSPGQHRVFDFPCSVSLLAILLSLFRSH